MNGYQWIESLIEAPAPIAAPEPMGAPTWWDVLEYVEDTQGRGASRFLADRLGVTIRTAQRYLSGQHQPARLEVRNRLADVAAEIEAERAADQDAECADAVAERARAHRKDVADFLRLIDRLDPQRITCRNKSTGSSTEHTYTVKPLDRMGPGLAEVADLWESGDFGGAVDALSDSIVARYGNEASDNRHGFATVLEIVDYPRGIDYS